MCHYEHAGEGDQLLQFSMCGTNKNARCKWNEIEIIYYDSCARILEGEAYRD